MQVHYTYMIMVITVPTDDLAPKGARPSAGTVMTTMLTSFLQNSSANG